MRRRLADYTNRPLNEATELELFNALLALVSDEAKERGYNEGKITDTHKHTQTHKQTSQ